MDATIERPKAYRGFAVIKDKNPEFQRELARRGGVARAATRVGEVSVPSGRGLDGLGAKRTPRADPAPRAPAQAGRVVYRTLSRRLRWWHYLPFLPEPADDLVRIDITASGSVGIRFANEAEVEGSGFSG